MPVSKRELSVVVPVYNVESYLEEALESIVKQTLGFDSNIELIIVNDGSTDESGAICEKYAEHYPDNVTYIKQQNLGVSAARNRGLEQSETPFVTFFDPDDVWELYSLEKSITFLKKNDNVDFVASKLLFFDSAIDAHPLNYKFDSTRVIDVDNEPDCPILHVISCVFRRDAVADRRFDERLSVSEDVKFLSEIIVDKKLYGVLSDTAYYYRKRSDNSSAVASKKRNKDWYIKTPELAYKSIIRTWTDKNGIIGRYAQHVILYDLSYRLKQDNQTVLDTSEEDLYKKEIYNLVRSLDDEVIATRHEVDIHIKLFLYKIKYGTNSGDFVTQENGLLFFKDLKIGSLDEQKVKFDFISPLSDGSYKIEGYSTLPSLRDGDGLRVELGSDSQKVIPVKRVERKMQFLGDTIFDGGGFEAKVKISPKTSCNLRIIAFVSGKHYVAAASMGRFTGVGSLRWSYRKIGAHTFINKGKNQSIVPYSTARTPLYELRFLLRVLFDWRLNSAHEFYKRSRTRNLAQLALRRKVIERAKPLLVILEAMVFIPQSVLLRIAYWLVLPFKKSPLWLIGDRGMAAGDNGEHLFRYIKKRSKASTDVYFVISKKSPDYERMKQYGKLLNQGSLRHKLYFLLADKIISSHADVEVTNPYFRQLDRYVNLLSFKFIFLQHGIIRHDLSAWLNKYETNIALFVVSAKKEYDSLFTYPYYYTKEQVCLSGLPRYDSLESKPKQKIIIAPTYRKDLAARVPTNTLGERSYDPNFKKSDYFQFYSDLLQDKRFLEAAQSSNMTIDFLLHPAFAEQVSDFKSNESVTIVQPPYDYGKAFKEGSMLISDYSSVVLDFAYLKKPVLYTHFDIDSLYERHSYGQADFFNDARDGFGPVTHSYNDLIEAAIGMVEAGCEMLPVYRDRVDSFFAYRDHDNSKRVYEAISAISDNSHHGAI